jgi:hypothetical protein
MNHCFARRSKRNFGISEYFLAVDLSHPYLLCVRTLQLRNRSAIDCRWRRGSIAP